MLIQFRGRIPLTIYPTFWIFAALIGYLNSMSFVGTLIWIGIIFVSVLFHEMGHALTALACGRHPRIELVALGGLTYHEGSRSLPFWKQFFIVFNGPLFGLILAVLATLLLHVPALSEGIPGSIISLTRLVNLFWTVVNLVPVMPLDGGQLLRLIFEKLCGAKGFRYALITSLVVSLLLSLFFFATQGFLIGALFFLFAFQSYDLLRKTCHFSVEDERDVLKEKIVRIEESLQKGDKAAVAALCREVRTLAHKGVIFETATQYLAFIEYEEGHLEAVYELLSPLKKDLAGDVLCLLQKAAFEVKDFALVAEAASSCFQTLPTVETALLSAYAHAQLKQVTASVGWLQTAIDEGLEDAAQVLANPLLDPIRGNTQFQEFQKHLRAE